MVRYMRYRDLKLTHHCSCKQIEPLPQLIALTVASSYFMAKGSQPELANQSRTFYMIANGLINLSIMQLMRN